MEDGKLSASLVERDLGLLGIRDSYSYLHSEHVGWLAGKIALEMGLSEDISKELCLAGNAHDLGKLLWPDDCFRGYNKEELSKIQFRNNQIGNICDWMEQHPTFSKNMIQNILINNCSNFRVENVKWLAWVWFHHWGYDDNNRISPPPDKKIKKYLKLLYAKFTKDLIEKGIGIMKVADSFHAAISRRDYRLDNPNPKPVSEALDEIVAGRKTKYHPEVVAAISNMEGQLKTEFIPDFVPDTFAGQGIIFQ